MTENGTTKRWLHEQGLCTVCKERDAFTMNGRWRCAECTEKFNAYRREYDARTRGEKAERERLYREEHKKNGLCVQCSRPAEDGYLMCSYHRAKNRNRKQAEYREKHPKRTGVCRCGKPFADGKRMCSDCCEKATNALRGTWVAKGSEHFWRKLNELDYLSRNA